MTKVEKSYREAVRCREWAESLSAPRGYMRRFKAIEHHRLRVWQQEQILDAIARKPVETDQLTFSDIKREYSMATD